MEKKLLWHGFRILLRNKDIRGLIEGFGLGRDIFLYLESEIRSRKKCYMNGNSKDEVELIARLCKGGDFRKINWYLGWKCKGLKQIYHKIAVKGFLIILWKPNLLLVGLNLLEGIQWEFIHLNWIGTQPVCWSFILYTYLQSL